MIKAEKQCFCEPPHLTITAYSTGFTQSREIARLTESESETSFLMRPVSNTKHQGFFLFSFVLVFLNKSRDDTEPDSVVRENQK